MRRLVFAVFPASPFVLVAACARTQPAVAPSASADTCPVLDAGPPPVCPDGCRWNGTECRKDSGVIIYGTMPNQPKPPPPPPVR
jgi:hypothetical protein